MKKIFIIFILIIINLSFLSTLKANCRQTFFDSESNAYCSKGDKILDYYEKLQDKSNSNKYLNSAKYYYYQASRLDLSNENALVGHARVALHQNRLKDAKNVLMIALNYNENNPKVNYYLGETFFREGEYSQAIDFFNKAYSHGFRYDYNTNYKMGLCYEKMDDIPKAKYHYNNAIKIRPDLNNAQERIDEINNIKTNYSKFDKSLKNLNDDDNEISPEDMKNLNMPYTIIE